MKNKIISIVLFFILAYLVPLLGKPELLYSPQILLLIIVSIVLFATQPPLSISESRQQKSNDHFSIYAILFGCLISQIIVVVEWAYFNSKHDLSLDIYSVAGTFLIVGGTIFRIWSIQTLGKYFTATVQTQSNQRIITTGAYSVIRHPSYFGSYMAFIGCGIFLHVPTGGIASAIIMFVVFRYRIKVEEATLVNEFGEEYKSYQARTKKIFPFIY